jgi:protein TonB
MPARTVRTDRFGSPPPGDRAISLAFAALVQAALGLALLSGFRIELAGSRDAVERLIEIGLPPPPPIVQAQPARHEPKHAVQHAAAAPKGMSAPPGGSPGPVPAHSSPSVRPVVAVQPSAPSSGGGAGSGPAVGSGSGGGAGEQGYGVGEDGGTDLVQIAGEILPRDYPRHLGDAGIGGTVSGVFTVEVNGRVSNCRVTRSSGVPELDTLTCRLMEKRFRFRPATDRLGRPVRDQVEWDHEWIPHGRY